MEWKKKEEGKQILAFMANWGRGKRHCPSKPKPVRAKPAAIVAKHKARKDVADAVLMFARASSWTVPSADPKKPFANGLNFGARLVSRGYVRLGAGCFSTVYAKEGSDRVIKVTSRPDNWIDYIKWAAENGYTGKYAPMVYSYKKFHREGGEPFSVSVVERMERTVSQIKRDEDLYIVPHLMWAAMREHKRAIEFTDQLVPGLSKFLLDFKKKFGESHDMCGSNMMVRKDGTFCITDPVAGKSVLNVKRFRSKDFSSLSPTIKVLNETVFFYNA